MYQLQRAERKQLWMPSNAQGEIEKLNQINMKSGDRDLLILLNESKYSRVEIERETSLINNLLPLVETLESRTKAVEVIDFNRNRISCDRQIVEKVLNRSLLRPFQFIFHKN